MLQGYSGCYCSYCRGYKAQRGKWIVNVKGNAKHGGEIAVLRENNRHGIASYGWFDEDKHKVFSSMEDVHPKIWKASLETAETIKDAFNAKEKK